MASRFSFQLDTLTPGTANPISVSGEISSTHFSSQTREITNRTMGLSVVPALSVNKFLMSSRGNL